MSFNKIIIVGNLGKDPELRYTPQGTPVCSFSVATNEKKRAAGGTGEEQSITTWFRVTLWGKQAESASKYLTKGRPVYIEGRLRVEEWNDRDGKARQSLEVHATDMQFIGTRGEEGDREFASAPSSAGGEPKSDYRDSRDNRTGGGRSVEPDDFDSGATDEDIPF